MSVGKMFLAKSHEAVYDYRVIDSFDLFIWLYSCLIDMMFGQYLFPSTHHKVVYNGSALNFYTVTAKCLLVKCFFT